MEISQSFIMKYFLLMVINVKEKDNAEKEARTVV